MKAKAWDPAKSGPLVSLGGNSIQPGPDPKDGRPYPQLDSYRRQLVRLGGLTAVVPLERLELSLEALPNPYDTLSTNEKFAAFLTTLTDAQWREISENGIAPAELSGRQRLLLQALIPHPLYAQEFIYGDGGYGSNGDAIPVSPEVAQRTRLQIFKALDVGFGALIDLVSKLSLWHGVSSSTYRPDGTHVYRAVDAPSQARQGLYAGTIEPNKEKPSQLDMKQAALHKSIPIATDESIGDLFAAIRETTGVEVYPDHRLVKLQLDAIGDHADAADLLRAVALCVSGAYRRVGPAFVLAPDLEGQAARAAQAAANEAMAKLSLQTWIMQAQETMKKDRLLDKLSFLPDDPFQGGLFLNTLNLPASVYGDGVWMPERTTNDVMRQAIPNFGKVPEPVENSPGGQRLVADPEKLHQVHYAVSVSYRFILPNKTVLDSQPLDLNAGVQYGGQATPEAQFPLDTRKLPGGSTVGYRTESPADAKAFCALAKQYGFKTIWMETTNSDVVDTVANSGLGMNLILRPWRLLKGENQDVDVNVLGQSGQDLNQIPEARMDYSRNVTWTYSANIPPSTSDLSSHWDRLVRLASDKRLHNLLLLDVVPDGYDGPSNRDYERIPTQPIFYNDRLMLRNLKDLAPLVYEFGYTTPLRLALLRETGFDPIDVEPAARKFPFAPLPYFEPGPGGDDLYPPLPPSLDDMTSAYSEFEKIRHDAAVPNIHQMLERFKATGHSVWMQFKTRNDDMGRIPLVIGPATTFDDPYAAEHDSAEILPIEPLNAETPSGQIAFVLQVSVSKQTCFDFGGVPVSKLSNYFESIFKRPDK